MARIAAVITAPVTALIWLAVAGWGIGWPWGLVAAAGCLVLPVAVVEVMLRLMPLRVRRLEVREPLRVVAVRLVPESKAVPGKAGESITEGN